MHTCMDRGWWCRKEGTDRGCNVPGRSDKGKSNVREGGRGKGVWKEIRMIRRRTGLDEK